MTKDQDLKERYKTHYQVDFENWEDWQYHPRNPLGKTLREHTQLLFTQSFNALNIQIAKKRILDFGCGYGNTLRGFIEWGARPQDLFGVDLLHWRLRFAKNANPAVHSILTRSGDLPFISQSMDIICQTIVFSSILEEQEHYKIASVLDRLLKPGGFLVWYDLFKTHEDYLFAFTLKQVMALFPGYKLKFQKKAQPGYFYKLAKFSPALCHFLFEYLPKFDCQSYFIIMEKPIDRQ